MNFQMPIPDRDDLPKEPLWPKVARAITTLLLLAVFILALTFWLLVMSSQLQGQDLPQQVGDVNFRKPLTLLFYTKDASYTPEGVIMLKKATVWNTTPGPDGEIVPGVLVGELPPVPKHVPVPDVSKRFTPSFDSRHCKALADGRAECHNVFLLPEAITAKR